jgi:hypothetical protein
MSLYREAVQQGDAAAGAQFLADAGDCALAMGQGGSLLS